MMDIETLERAVDMAVLALTREGNSDVAITLNNHITEYKRQVHVLIDDLPQDIKNYNFTPSANTRRQIRCSFKCSEILQKTMEAKNDGQ
jgi:hypothetical protein